MPNAGIDFMIEETSCSYEELYPKAEGVSKPVGQLAFLVPFILSAMTATNHFMLIPMYMVAQRLNTKNRFLVVQAKKFIDGGNSCKGAKYLAVAYSTRDQK